LQSEAKGFFASLFDLSFSSLVTTKIIKVLYVITLVLIGLGYLVFTISAFAADSGAGALVLFIIGPLVALFYTIYARVFLEIVIALFRIMESNVEMVGLMRGQGQPAAVPPPAQATPPPNAPSGPAVG
jgi:hypothetical protein